MPKEKDDLFIVDWVKLKIAEVEGTIEGC